MDDRNAVASLLESWGQGHLIATFHENEIDIEAMKVLGHEDLIKLIPKVGPRTKFWSKLQTWQKSLQEMNTNNSIVDDQRGEQRTFQQDFVPIPTASQSRSLHDDFVIPVAVPEYFLTPHESLLEDIININNESRELTDVETESREVTDQASSITKCRRNVQNTINAYIDEDVVNSAGIREAYDSDSFEDKHQLKLSRLIVTKELKNDTKTKIRPERFAKLAEEIQEVFPREDKRKYYIPRCVINGKNIAPKGKLYNQYTNLVKKFRQNGLRGQKDNDEVETAEDNCQNVDIANDVAWLSMRVEPWEIVEAKWRATAEYRLSNLQKRDQNSRKRKKPSEPPVEIVADYLQQYKALRQANGYKLLESDFLFLYPECEGNLTNKWAQFAQKVLELSPQKDGDSSGQSQVTVFHKFAQLFDPITLIARTGKYRIRPTKIEMAEGFLLHVQVIDDLKPAIERLRAKSLALKTTLQPLPVSVGIDSENITESYVAIDDILYKVDSPLRAVDICFKSIHALHAEYSVQSQRPWLVLQQVIYGITTAWDAQIPSVIDMCNKLRL